MRKLVKLLTITTIATTSALQVTACKDDSKFDTFMSDISNSIRSSSAFFGFLGSADDSVSQGLKDSIDNFNSVDSSSPYNWQNWVNSREELKNNERLKIENIYLHYYQGPYHQDKPSDPVASFWNDKSISWQRNIFNWVYSNTKNNPNFKTPKQGAGVNELTTKKENDEERFEALPIVFIISKGKLITAGQNWTTDASPAAQFTALTNFIIDNLLSI